MEMENEAQEIQELVFAAMTCWHYRIIKPLKQILEDGISLEMYYSLQMLRRYEDGLIMTELANHIDMQKQQLTKLINSLVERGFVERIYNPKNRRIIRIKITESGTNYIDSFLTHDAEYLKDMIEKLSEADRQDFRKALNTFIRILIN